MLINSPKCPIAVSNPFQSSHVLSLPGLSSGSNPTSSLTLNSLNSIGAPPQSSDGSSNGSFGLGGSNGKPPADNIGEQLDYFDALDRRLGTLPRKEVHRRGLINRHVIFFLVNSENRLALQKRSAAKKDNPGQFDKVGGHVKAGQDYDERELFEEYYDGVSDDMNLTQVPYEQFWKSAADPAIDHDRRVIASFLACGFNWALRRVNRTILPDGEGTLYEEKIEHINTKVFLAHCDRPPSIQEAEVASLRWFTKQELMSEIAADRMVQNSLNSVRIFTNDLHDLLDPAKFNLLDDLFRTA